MQDCLEQSICKNQNNSEGSSFRNGYLTVLYIHGVTESIKITLSGFEFLKALDWSVKMLAGRCNPTSA